MSRALKSKSIKDLERLIEHAIDRLQNIEAAQRYPGKKLVKRRIPVNGCQVRAHSRGATVREQYLPVKKVKRAKKKAEYVHVPQEPLWDNRLARPAKLGFNDIAVCATIRGLTSVPGEIRRKAIAEVIDVANNPDLRRCFGLRLDDPCIHSAFMWHYMPSGPSFWLGLSSAALKLRKLL